MTKQFNIQPNCTSHSKMDDLPLFSISQKQNNVIMTSFGIVTGSIIGLIIGSILFKNTKKKYTKNKNANTESFLQKIMNKIKQISNDALSKQKLIIYMIRHVEIVNDVPKTFMSPISENGLNQAHCIGKRLMGNKINFDKMFSSPTVRAHDTCQIVRSYMDKPKILVSDDLLSRVSEDESYQVIGQRIRNFLENEIYDKNTSEEPLILGVFAHGLVIRSLLQNIQNEKNEHGAKYQIDNGSITELSYDPLTSVWKIIRVNDHAHCEHLIKHY